MRDIYLYHGTHSDAWHGIQKGGFRIPSDTNWLGRGVYWGYDNFLIPVSYAVKAARRYGNEPVLLRVAESCVLPSVLERTLDLTKSDGLLSAYYMIREFGELLDEFSDDDLRRGFHNSPMYSAKVRRDLSLDMNWYLTLKLIQPVLDALETTGPPVDELRNASHMHISNILIDWFNYYRSAGTEGRVPIRIVKGSFNTGSPLFLPNRALDHRGGRLGRVFYDFISFLNRTELSVLGFRYYWHYDGVDQYWKLDEIIRDPSTSIKPYCGRDDIVAFISRRIRSLALATGGVAVSAGFAAELAHGLYDQLGCQSDDL